VLLADARKKEKGATRKMMLATAKKDMAGTMKAQSLVKETGALDLFMPPLPTVTHHYPPTHYFCSTTSLGLTHVSARHATPRHATPRHATPTRPPATPATVAVREKAEKKEDSFSRMTVAYKSKKESAEEKWMAMAGGSHGTHFRRDAGGLRSAAATHNAMSTWIKQQPHTEMAQAAVVAVVLSGMERTMTNYKVGP
jgi:hypothetical protein